MYSTEHVHQFTPIYAILGWFIENESRFLLKFLITTNQIKLQYSLLTSLFIQCCNKDVIIYFGASVSEFIRAIRSFIRIYFIMTLCVLIQVKKSFDGLLLRPIAVLNL